ncbi:MAG TPA: hypothetical protein VNY31_08945 [Solirubrobacteraceae bacterium]|nr:hypothetical protein [Solirubrobacteraceae bacterium]
MKSHARVSLMALITGAIIALAGPAAAQAEFGVASFFASNCKVNTCKKVPPAEEKEKAEKEGFTQAAGHPNFGITDFTVNTHEGPEKALIPDGTITHIRTDVAPGLSTNPEAVEKCTAEEFGTKEFIPGKGLYLPPTCGKESEIGTNNVVVYVKAIGKDIPLSGKVYNLVQPEGRASLFGVALDATNLGAPGLFAHTLIEGNVEWASDYHDYFEINVSPTLPLISSRLTFLGNIGKLGKGGFLTNPTSCPGHTTSTIRLQAEGGGSTEGTYTPPIGNENCGAVPFEPGFALAPETTQSDQPDGITTELSLPHNPGSGSAELDSSQVRTATVTLPEGMTLNPAAAAGLEACSPAQARIHSLTPGVACPAASKIGTVALNVPGLPAGSLNGNVYLGGPESGPIGGPPYIVYVDAESARYGISVRLKGETTPNETTGQVTTVFSENPEQPFSNLKLTFKGGALAPIANPLGCGSARSATSFVPFTGTAAKEPFSEFVVDSNNAKGPCASPLPFAPSQTTQNQTANAGGHTSYTFNLERPEGQQNFSQVKTVLPPGLVGAIPAVTPCTEPQAGLGTCSSASQIGTARVLVGSGPTPFALSGPVYLTGPYQGAPYGMSIAVPAIAGPFNLGTDVTRATINVNQTTAQVIVTSVIPRVFKGVALRLRRISVAIEKQGFLFNPTNCSALATESSVTGFIPGSSTSSTVNLSSPFQVANCAALGFKPTFKAATSAKTSKSNGASLETTLNYVPGQANVKSVFVQLPKQLPSRLTTLQKACLQATFEANPFRCPSGSYVGGVRANTPTLPDKMKGPAVLVSHGGAAFPDLDLVLEADGVRVILVGNTDIKNGITKTNFASTPDVPVSSVTVNLPIGPHSALGAFGDLCATPLVMPTTITGQNGKVIKQNTKINVSGCGVKIVGHKVIGNTAYLTIKTFAAGRISGSGSNLASVSRHLNGAVNATTLKVSLRRGAHRPLTTRVRVGFVPKRKGPSSAAFVTVRFG